MPRPDRRRLDQLLVDRGLAPSRTRAQALIMAGVVFSAGKRLDKPGRNVAGDTEIEVRGKDHPWVSRGGVKLASALDHFGLSPKGLVCIDVGASTGGFTDVMLKHGAERVYAVDVGRGQLDWKLRNDERVVVLEKTNARNLTDKIIPEPAGFIGCDASFIGLRTVLAAALALAAPGAVLVALIKPQFEVGRGQIGKKGVVRDPVLHAEVCEAVESWLGSLPGWTVIGLTESPIEGPEGNKEFLIAANFSPGAATTDR